jgi:hypothetical protein
MRLGARIWCVGVTVLVLSCGKSGSSSSDDGSTAGKPLGGASRAGSTSAGASGSAGNSVGGTSGATGAGRSGAGTAGTGNSAGVGGSAGSAGTGVSAGTSGTTNSSGGASGSGGEGGEGGGGEGGEAGVAETPPGGQISLAYVKETDGHHFTQTSAAFWRASVPSTAPNPCEVRTYGACTVATCPSTPADPAPPSTAAPDAGAISLTAAAASYTKTLNPYAAYGAYETDVDTTVEFLGGESVSFSASGGEIPAFSGTIAMPVPLAITNELPARDQNGNIPFHVAEDLVLDLSGGLPGVVVQVDGYTGISGGPTKSSLHCIFDSEAGTLTIPTAALTPLGTSALVHLFTLRRSSLEAGACGVQLVFGTNVNAADGLFARLAGVP